jgi:hypothetical protein
MRKACSVVIIDLAPAKGLGLTALALVRATDSLGWMRSKVDARHLAVFAQESRRRSFHLVPDMHEGIGGPQAAETARSMHQIFPVELPHSPHRNHFVDHQVERNDY